MARSKLQLAAVILLSLVMVGCGYRFSGSGSLPEDVERIFISIFQNRTNEIGMETIFTDDLTNEFILRRKKALASKKQADADLKGTILSIRTRTISQTKLGTSVDREVIVVVSVKLVGNDGAVIWSASNIRARQAYNVADDRLQTEANKREAIANVSLKMAERIYNQLTEDF